MKFNPEPEKNELIHKNKNGCKPGLADKKLLYLKPNKLFSKWNDPQALPRGEHSPRKASNHEQEVALMKRLAQDDQKAFEALIKDHQREVRVFLRHRLGSEEAAQEVSNDVFLQVWRCAAKFQGKSKIRYWIIGIARNLVNQRIQQRKRRLVTEPLDGKNPGNGDGSEARSFEDRSPGQELAFLDRQRLCEVMKKLSPKQAEALVLVFVKGLPYKEVAQIQDCPESTVKTRIFNARKNLRQELSRFDGDEDGSQENQ